MKNKSCGTLQHNAPYSSESRHFRAVSYVGCMCSTVAEPPCKPTVVLAAMLILPPVSTGWDLGPVWGCHGLVIGGVSSQTRCLPGFRSFSEKDALLWMLSQCYYGMKWAQGTPNVPSSQKGMKARSSISRSQHGHVDGPLLPMTCSFRNWKPLSPTSLHLFCPFSPPILPILSSLRYRWL